MRLGSIVIDSDDVESLSEFYKKLLGWTKETQYFEGDKWIIVKSEDNQGTPLVFQEVQDYIKPTWPNKKGLQQQMLHLDFYVQADKFEKEVAYAIACGATCCEIQLSDHWKVMIDPMGHPFCIIPLP